MQPVLLWKKLHFIVDLDISLMVFRLVAVCWRCVQICTENFFMKTKLFEICINCLAYFQVFIILTHNVLKTPYFNILIWLNFVF